MKKKISKLLGVVLTLALISSLAIVSTPPVSAAIGTNALGEVTLPKVSDGTDVGRIAVAPDGTLFASVQGSDGKWDLWRSPDGFTWTATKFVDSVPEINAIACVPNWGASKTVYVGLNNGNVYRCADAGDTTPVLLKSIVDNVGATANVVYDIDLWFDGSDIWVLVATNIDVLVLRDALFEDWRDQELTISFPAADSGPITCDVTAATGTFTRTAGSFLTDGFKAGNVIVTTGFTNAGNNTTKIISTVTATTITVTSITGLVNETGNGDERIRKLDGFGAALECAYAPDFSSSSLIWAIIKDSDGDFWVTSTVSPGQWGQAVKNVEIDCVGNAGTLVDLAFPYYYHSVSAPILFVALNETGTGGKNDLFKIEGSRTGTTVARALLVNGGGIGFQSIEVSGEVIMGGAHLSNNVWVSQNGGDTFTLAIKLPTGVDQTNVLMKPGAFDPTAGTAYAATKGTESAFSRTTDGGATWNQTAFVDTTIGAVLDIAFSATGKPAALITQSTTGNIDSLWRTADITATTPQWERVLCTPIVSLLDDFKLVEYSMDGTTVMLYGLKGSDVIWKSTDNLQTWNYLRPALMGAINDWVVYDGATIYAACSGGFFGTTRFGPPQQELSGTNLVSIALQPGFNPNDPAKDTVIAGNNDGKAYVSNDAGDNWGSAQSIDSGNVYVAFDALSATKAYFATYAYDSKVRTATVSVATTAAAADMKLTGTTDLKDSLNGVADVGRFSGLCVASDNVLYAMGGTTDTGVYLFRLLLGEEGNVWETARKDFSVGLWGSTPNTLWTVVNLNKLWALKDTVSGKVDGVTVSDIKETTAKVSWTHMTGAKQYQVKYDSTVVPAPSTPSSTPATTATISPLTDNTTYAVKVRVATGQTFQSRWSTAVTLTTLEAIGVPVPAVPAQGLQGAPLLPSFVWGAVSNAYIYDFQLSTVPSFITTIISTDIAAPITAYTCTTTLAYDTDHYWRIRAVSTTGTRSAWCTTQNFHTRVEPIEQLPPVTIPPAPTPTIILPTPTVVVPVPDITVVPPPITVIPPDVKVTVIPPEIIVDIPDIVLPTPTTTIVEPKIEMPEEVTPIYIWIIVAIGAVLVTAVIILIIRTRRVV